MANVSGSSSSPLLPPHTPPSHTSPSSAIDEIKALPSQKSYTQKVAEHIKIINSASPSDLQALKTYYQDKPYLSQKVHASLKAQHSDKIEALFGSTPPVFKGELYRDLLKHQYSPENIGANQLLDQKRDVAVYTEATTTSQIPVPRRPVAGQPKSPGSTVSAKERYLAGIRTTAMLGNHEMQHLADLIKRPIVVVRAEESAGKQGSRHANNVELIVYPTGVPQALGNPVYVQNIRNGHFRTFTPASRAVAITGNPLQGSAKEGDYRGAGINDCLIASIKGNGVLFNMSNIEVRKSCAADQVRNGDDNAYVADMGDSGAFIDFPDDVQIPKGFTGHVIIKPSTDYYAQGPYTEGRIGEWSFLTPHGLFGVTYDPVSHKPLQIVQTGEYNNLGKLDLLINPIMVSDIANGLNLIKLS